MNQDFEDIRRKIENLVHDVELSHVITQYIVTLDEGKRFRAGQQEPRIRVPNADRTDGWRERVQKNFNSANDEERDR